MVAVVKDFLRDEKSSNEEKVIFFVAQFVKLVVTSVFTAILNGIKDMDLRK